MQIAARCTPVMPFAVCASLLAALVACGGELPGPSPQGLSDATPLRDAMEILPGASPVIPSLGTGWNTAAESYMGRCVRGSTRRLPAADAAGTLKITSSIDAEKAQHQMGFQMGTRAHFAIGSASLKAQAASAMTQDAYSSVWVFSANYNADAEELDFDSPTELTVIGQAANKRGSWQHECGDEFVYQVQKGAQLFIVYRLDFKSESVKKQVDGTLGGRHTVVDVNAELKRLSDFMARHAQLTVEVYQFGGDPTRITGIVTGPSADLAQAETAARAVVQCGVEDLSACESFLTRALLYATSLSETDAFPHQISSRATPTLYVTMPWSRLGHVVNRTPDSRDVANARLDLAMLFDRVLTAKKRVDLLIGSTWSDRAQREELEPWRLRLAYQLNQINNAVVECYDDLTVAASAFTEVTVQRCQRTVRHLQKTIDLPPAEALRGATERAITATWHQVFDGQGTDPAATAFSVADAQCAIIDERAICAHETSRGATAHVLSRRIVHAWNDLSPELQALARSPMGDKQDDHTATYVNFAPHAAIIDDGTREPKLLHGAVLDHFRLRGGVQQFGVPVSHTRPIPDSEGIFAHFALGMSIYCRPGHGCWEMPEASLNVWLERGAGNSCLEYPKVQQPDTWITCFNGGQILYNPNRGDAPALSCPAPRWGWCR